MSDYPYGTSVWTSDIDSSLIIGVGLTEDGDLVLDFFAGSGTTPSVAHKMNKKYIAIEMGEYFDTKTILRMKYTLYGNSGDIKSKKQGGFLGWRIW